MNSNLWDVLKILDLNDHQFDQMQMRSKYSINSTREY